MRAAGVATGDPDHAKDEFAMADRSTITRIAPSLAALLALVGCSQEPERRFERATFYYSVPPDWDEMNTRQTSVPYLVGRNAVIERKPRGLHYAYGPGWDCTDAAKNDGWCRRGTLDPTAPTPPGREHATYKISDRP